MRNIVNVVGAHAQICEVCAAADASEHCAAERGRGRRLLGLSARVGAHADAVGARADGRTAGRHGRLAHSLCAGRSVAHQVRTDYWGCSLRCVQVLVRCVVNLSDVSM